MSFLSLFSSSKGNSGELKDILLKELFRSSNQKKVVTRAARESAEDQKNLIVKYNEMIRKNPVLQK